VHQLEFFFDCSSPWTYLAFENVQATLAGLDVAIVWKPILVGGVFNTVNPSVYYNRDQQPVAVKQAYARKDLQDWAAYAGLKIGMPEVFPVNSVKAMRGAFVAIEQALLVPYARAVFQRYWGDLADISQDAVLAGICESVGLDNDEFFTKIATQSYKDLLRHTTDELIGRGGYGSPTMYLDADDMYFGNDRVELIRAKLAGG
jgi:2-hydroxychromene-2-carboxylate isomerase